MKRNSLAIVLLLLGGFWLLYMMLKQTGAQGAMSGGYGPGGAGGPAGGAYGGIGGGLGWNDITQMMDLGGQTAGEFNSNWYGPGTAQATPGDPGTVPDTYTGTMGDTGGNPIGGGDMSGMGMDG